MIVKTHESNGKKIIAITDLNIIGKKFEEKNLQLDLTADFYKGEEMNEEKIEAIIINTYVIHFTGKESVNFGIKLGLIDKKQIIKIKNIPHAETLIIGD